MYPLGIVRFFTARLRVAKPYGHHGKAGRLVPLFKHMDNLIKAILDDFAKRRGGRAEVERDGRVVGGRGC